MKTEDSERKPQGAARPIKFGMLEEPEQVSQPSSIDLLKDVPLLVTAELGRTKMLVKEILRLGEGSIIELDKEAGQPVDILVNNKLIARGEVVEIDGNYGIKITEVHNQGR